MLAVSQKYEYKLFLFELFQGRLHTLKKYKAIHTSTMSLRDMITDLSLAGDTCVTVSRDKTINLFKLLF